MSNKKNTNTTTPKSKTNNSAAVRVIKLGVDVHERQFVVVRQGRAEGVRP